MAARININLATEPFRRDRPLIAGSIAMGLLLLACLGLLITLVASERSQAAEARDAVARLEADLARLTAEQTKLEAVLREPRNAEVLERSMFLNALLRRKGISWTRIFADLEKIVPHNVRLISVRPEIRQENEIRLDMVVGAQTSEPVLNMLGRMESSALFGPATLTSWLPPSQTDPLYRYRVSVSYQQKL